MRMQGKRPHLALPGYTPAMSTPLAHYRYMQPALIRETVGGDSATLLEVLLVFQRIATPTLSGLEAAVSEGNWLRAEALSHDLKGMALLAGADQLAGLAQTLESGARRTAGGLAELLPALRGQLGLVLGEVETCVSETRQLLASTHTGVRDH